MTKMAPGYYWILLLSSGVWQIAKYYDDGTFQLIGETKQYRWENIGQVGERVPSNYELKQKPQTA